MVSCRCEAGLELRELMSRRGMHKRRRVAGHAVIRGRDGSVFRVLRRARSEEEDDPPFLFEVQYYDPETDSWDFMRHLPSRKTAYRYVDYWITRGPSVASRYAYFAWKRRDIGFFK